MVGVAGARNHQQIFPERADLGYDFINTLGFVDRHDHGGGFHKAAAFQKLGICRVSVKDGSTLPALLRNGRGIVVDGDVLELVAVEHRADHLSDPAVADDDGMAAPPARRGREFGIKRLVFAQDRRQPPREMGQRGDQHHRQRGQGYREAR